MKILNLNLKRKWFDMILSGEKKEEYREVKDYWARRLLDILDPCGMEPGVLDEMVGDLCHPFNRHSHVTELLNHFGAEFTTLDAIRFKNGYAKNAPEFLIECKGVDVKNGNETWGADKGAFYFTLKLGKILERN